MATKKKAAKPAKKSTNVKKIAPAKKAAAKPAHSSGGSKATKKAPGAKSTVKPVAKKVAPATPAKKPVAAPKKAGVASVVSKPVQKPQPTHPPVAATAKPVVAGNNTTLGKSVPTTPPPVAIKPEVKKPAPPPPKPTKVVIPEIKTKTVRKYEPEFTKSVLDSPQEEQTGPTMRYSDAELGEFRELINRKLDAAKKELAYLQGLITRKDEMGGDNDDARYMTMEDGSMSMEREQLSQMASRQITFIDHLEKALMRIENKTYGICRVTGKLIDKARLRAVPHATLSIEAKQMMNK
ncbi:MAG TPA: TraR/DksA C4-type zinc finger protein [Puia sp.]|nr:TraR/DksA C4-type zinc finger protein [Puia sp.]